MTRLRGRRPSLMFALALPWSSEACPSARPSAVTGSWPAIRRDRPRPP